MAKVNVNASAKKPVVNNKEAQASRNTTRLVRGMQAKLSKYRKVAVKIPIDNQNPKDLDVLVQINGYAYRIRRGVTVEIPEPVLKLLEKGGYV